ncbi:CPCC family cysteine-rich protein [Rhizomonospora bruguierae]|uniref:CPCC family cysteine-rich protein n=1 Tax=Rhizomonospora bruguierae TaxID=1581705 RepID=UPI001BCC8561|nr:CPCC family cysteine-rich protein [Micromonospora sp. NBRC 107566]
MGQLLLPRCPCCGYRTGCRTCPVCYWTDDGQGDADASVVRGGPNGELSLSDARLNFAIYGASDRRYRDLVRPPRVDEYP